MKKVFTFITIVHFMVYNNAVLAQTNKIIEYSRRVFFDKDELHQEEFYHIWVNDKNGLHLASFDAFVKPGENFILQEATVLDMNGKKIKNYNSKDITTRNHIEYQKFYTDYQIKTISLTNKEFPFQIKIKYTTTTKNWLFLALWYPVKHQDVMVDKASLIVNIPKNQNIKTKANFLYQYASDTSANMISHV